MADTDQSAFSGAGELGEVFPASQQPLPWPTPDQTNLLKQGYAQSQPGKKDESRVPLQPQPSGAPPISAFSNNGSFSEGLTPEEQRRDADLKKGLTKLYGEKSVNDQLQQDDLKRQREKYNSQLEEMRRREGVSAAEIRPWNEQTMAPQKTSLWEKFGSPGFVLAMCGSAFTALPMNSAMQAGGAAMNAINDGDFQARQEAMKVWKENTDLAFKRLDEQHKTYSEILQQQSHDLETKRIEISLAATKYGDDLLKTYADAGMFPEMDKILLTRYESKIKAVEAQKAILEQDILFNTLNGHPAQEGEPVTHKDAKGNPIAGGDPDYYTGRDQAGAYARVESKLAAAKRSGLGMGAINISQAQDTISRFEKDIGKSLSGNSKNLIEGAYLAGGGKREVAIAAVADAENEINDLIKEGKTPSDTEIDRIISSHVVSAMQSSRSSSSTEIAKDIPKIKADLAKILGRPLSQSVSAAIDAAYGAKGQAAQRVYTAANEAIDDIKSRLGSGAKLTDEDIAKEINESAQFAAMPAGRGALPLFMQTIMADPSMRNLTPAQRTSRILGLGALWTETQRMAGTIGTATATITRASKELDSLGPLAMRASDANARSDIKFINEIRRALRIQQSVPAQVVFNQLNLAVATAYGQVIGRGNTQVTDYRTRLANDTLNTAFGTAAYKADIESMMLESKVVTGSLMSAKEELYGPGVLEKRMTPYTGSDNTDSGWKIEKQ